MRDLFDRRLTDPTADDVAAALVDASAAVNANRATGNLAIDAVAPLFVQQFERERSGRQFVFGDGAPPGQPPIEIGRLELAWWTNPAGRKLVRVRGWRERDRRGGPFTSEAQAFAEIERDRNGRPAVWHIDPERLIETYTAGDPEWVAVCGCGAAGSAETLCWHHGMCGPCADRVAEFGPEFVTHQPGLLADPDFVPRDVVFTSEGKFVVAVGNSGFRVWDVATGTPRGAGSSADLDPTIRPVASPDGRYVFLGDVIEGGLLLAPADNTVYSRFSLATAVSAAHWTGRAKELLLQTIDYELHFANVDGHSRSVSPPLGRFAKLCAVWPDATAPLAAFAAGHRASVCRIERDGTFVEVASFALGQGALNRTGVWEGGPKIVRFTPDGERILFVRGAEMELRLPSRPKALQQVEFPHPVVDVAFAPDYERVYVLTANGVINVCSPGMLTSVRARLRWHVESATRLAISPDGRTLATAGPEGVKLWPVASLLPLLD